MQVEIYRLKEDPELDRRARFLGSRALKKEGLWPPDPKNYKGIQGVSFGPLGLQSLDEALEYIFSWHRENREPGVYAMSVGDIIVVYEPEPAGAYFCDKTGWTPLPKKFYDAVKPL